MSEKVTGSSQNRIRLAISLTPPVLLCAFLLVTSVSVGLPEVGIYNGKRILQLGLLAVILIIALIYRPLRHSTTQFVGRVPVPLSVALIAIFLTGFWSATRFQNPVYSYVELAMLISLVSAAFVIAGARQLKAQAFDRVISVLLAATFLAVFFQEMMGLFAHLSIDAEFTYVNMFINFAHHRFFNQLQTWTVPLIAALPFIFQTRKNAKFLAIFLIGAQWYLMLASGARGSVVSLVVSVSFVSIWAFPVARRWLVLNLMGVISGLALYYLVLTLQKLSATTGGQFVARSVGRSLGDSTGRTWVWGFAWQDAIQHPLLGAGPARFACATNELLPGHPHNIVLQLASEWGFPVTIAVFVIVSYLTWHLLRKLNAGGPVGEKYHSTLKLSLAASLIAAAIHSAVSGLLVMPASQVCAVLICGWAMSVLMSNREYQGGTGRFPKLIAVSLVFSLLLFTFGISELQKMEYRLSGIPDTEPQMPRFWQQGRICKYTFD